VGNRIYLDWTNNGSAAVPGYAGIHFAGKRAGCIGAGMMAPTLGGFVRASFAAAAFAITVDGNSISDAAVSDLIPQLNALAPISNKFTITNKAINGQSVQQMIANAADVDNSFVVGKVNYLLIFEITNNIFNDGRTGLQTCVDLEAYIAARLAVHPWRVILMTALPRGDFLGATYTATTGEVQLQAANNYIRQNYRAMGAIALVEARRPGGPFDFTDSTNAANFPSSLWTDRTHPNSAGKAILAGYIADVLKRLPAR